MSSNAEDVFDVFLSHSHVDAVRVEEIAKRIEDEAHLRVWLDKWILVPGEHWQQAMAKGLDRAKSCGVCIGGQTPKGWFNEEIQRSLNRQTKDSTFRVIPILLPNADPTVVDNFLELRTWVNFKDSLQDSEAFHILISGIRGVSPGRGPTEPVIANAQHIQVRDKLIQLRQLRTDQLIDDAIALEYQRKLLDVLILD